MEFSKILTFNKNKVVNGWIMPFYKQTDEEFENYSVKFIYASSIAPKSRKGPHMHLKRECRIIPISGKIQVTIRNDSKYCKFVLDSNFPKMIIIETGTPFCLDNFEDSEAIIINLANHIWTSEDQDTNVVTDWI